VHEGLDPSHRGKARYVQVVEVHERHIHTRPYNVQVGPDSGFATKTVLGAVPVEPDGSAYFRVPAGKSIFLTVLDENYQALHTMRSVTNVQDGERTSCVGCHEPAGQTPPNQLPLATQRPASDMDPPPWGVQPMEYADVVQPVLDKHCVRCHDGTKAEGKAYDLTARKMRPYMGVAVPLSYFNLRKYVRHAPIHQYYLAPGTFGSRVSPVTKVLAKGHNKVALSVGDWRRLCAWIDCNAPYLGRYDNLDARRAKPQGLDPPPYNKAHIDARRAAIAEQAPAGYRLACYLDCGPQIECLSKSGPRLRVTRGWPYQWAGSSKLAPAHFGTIAFEDQDIVLEASGLSPDRTYQLAFSWWDVDSGQRAQSVHVEGGEPWKAAALLPKTLLPCHRAREQAPEEKCLPIPSGLYTDGKLRIIFRKEGSANAVVSEVWLWEGE